MTPPLIFANVMAPYVAWGVGDDAGLSLPFSMLATTFAAMVERPFYRSAGIHLSFRYSMQANVLSWFVGLLLAYGSMIMGLQAFFYLMCFLAVPFSILIEGRYLSSIAHKTNRTKLKWGPVIAGNVLSGILLFGITVFGFEYGDRMQRAGSSLIWMLRQNKPMIHWGVAIGCVLLFSYCCRPRFQTQLDGQNVDRE